MIRNLRNFSKTKFAGILVGIIIIPFVFWGMGSVFSGGNTNNIAKINNKSISTQDFMNHLNDSKVSLETLKNNIDNNIIEETLADLISNTMLQLEIQDLNLLISDKTLKKKIIKNKNFFDENNKFSRTKYEKFLLSSNLTAPGFELKMKNNELKKNLFSYVVGGINSPLFLSNNAFKEQTKKITINFINLTNVYKKEEDFSKDEISKYIEENKETLKEKRISFNYSKITPETLIGINEYNELFFKRIDEIENDISNGTTFSQLINTYKLKSVFNENFKLNNENKSETDDNKIFNKIFENGEQNEIKLLEENNFYLIYEITKIEKILPKVENVNFISKVKGIMFNKAKNEFNFDLLKKLGTKSFNQSDFDELSNSSTSKIEKITVDSINDNKKFNNESIQYLYSLPKDTFALISDKNKNIYLIKVLNILENNISKGSQDFKKYYDLANIKIRDSMYGSYDLFLNKKYKVKINQKTLERVKNYFQ